MAGQADGDRTGPAGRCVACGQVPTTVTAVWPAWRPARDLSHMHADVRTPAAWHLAQIGAAAPHLGPGACRALLELTTGVKGWAGPAVARNPIGLVRWRAPRAAVALIRATVADPDGCLLAPDKRPPRTGWHWTQNGAFFGEGLLACDVRGGAQFPVDFVLVDLRQQLIQEAIGLFQFNAVIGGQEWWEAFLPVVVAAFDFALGLRGWGVEEFDAVEVEGLTELGEGVGVLVVEEGVKVHIESQGQAVGFEDAGEKVVVGQQGFRRIEAGTDIEAGGIVQNIKQGLFVGIAREPDRRAGIVLPESAQIPGLPAFDGLGCGFVAGVGSELVLDGPVSNAGAVGFEAETAMEFAGTGAVGRRWF